VPLSVTSLALFHRKIFFLCQAIWLFCFLAPPIAAHELWLEPQPYQGEAGQILKAEIRIGQDFIGDGLLYRPGKIEQLGFLTKEGWHPISGRLGDRPAIQAAAPHLGQNIVIYQTKPENLIYSNIEKFADFVREKSDEALLHTHQQRGLPDKEFSESYRRFAKSIFWRGPPQKGIADRYSGMAVELVLEEEPGRWLDDNRLAIRLYYQGKPHKQAKITIFEKSDGGKVTKSYKTTDQSGRIYLTPQSGFEYLIDHVVIKPVNGTPSNVSAVWESLWASLTFATPKP